MESAYERLLPVITAVKEIKKPNAVPAAIAHQEAINLFFWCGPDLAAMEKNGLDREMVSRLPDMAMAMAEAEARWQGTILTYKENLRRIRRQADQANLLARDLKFQLGFFLRDEDNQKRLADIHINRNYTQIASNLLMLYTIGDRNREMLEPFNFDQTLLYQAGKIAQTLQTDVAFFNSRQDRSSRQYLKAKEIRNQAYTCLKQMVDRLRQCGQFTFRDNESRRVGYRSEHIYRANVRARAVRRVRKAPPAEMSVKQELHIPGMEPLMLWIGRPEGPSGVIPAGVSPG